ncbi:hypothetical protein Tco_1425535 [Tanacetum coccineum]
MLAEEEATKAVLSNEYDFVQARLNADKILAEKFQEEEREMYTIKSDDNFIAIGSGEDEKLKLETEEDSTMALELIRFVKKQIAELEPEDSDGDEKDL